MHVRDMIVHTGDCACNRSCAQNVVHAYKLRAGIRARKITHRKLHAEGVQEVVHAGSCAQAITRGKQRGRESCAPRSQMSRARKSVRGKSRMNIARQVCARRKVARGKVLLAQNLRACKICSRRKLRA